LSISDQNFWLNINKPEDYSSAKVVAIVKRITKASKVGHCGTLDPFATGVLPIAINKATKTCSYITDAIKKYYFEISWGEFRDSDDLTGNVIDSSNARPTTQEIIGVLAKFVGKINQVPSIFSAIKIDGQRSYDLARQGVDVKMKSRQVEISKIILIFNNQEKAGLEVICSKGTYIRSLARDLAKELKVCGYVSLLTRLQVGDFTINNGISLAKLKNIVNYACPNNLLLQLRDVLNFIPEIELNNFDASKIKNGQFVEITQDQLPDHFTGRSRQNSSHNILTVKVISEGVLISLASLENSWLKPLNNFN
jgi:tRNA pseudouridine55 synthase